LPLRRERFVQWFPEMKAGGRSSRACA